MPNSFTASGVMRASFSPLPSVCCSRARRADALGNKQVRKNTPLSTIRIPTMISAGSVAHTADQPEFSQGRRTNQHTHKPPTKHGIAAAQQSRSRRMKERKPRTNASPAVISSRVNSAPHPGRRLPRPRSVAASTYGRIMRKTKNGTSHEAAAKKESRPERILVASRQISLSAQALPPILRRETLKLA